MVIKLFFDGACNNQPGWPKCMGIGVAVFVNDIYDEELSIAKGYDSPYENEVGTNNVAEWLGCIEAMKVAKELRQFYKHSKLEVYSDSQIITNLFNGDNRSHKPNFIKFKEIAERFAIGLYLRVKWIPREQNKHADKLSKIGIKSVAESSSVKT